MTSYFEIDVLLKSKFGKIEVSVALCALWIFRVCKSLNLQISKTPKDLVKQYSNLWSILICKEGIVKHWRIIYFHFLFRRQNLRKCYKLTVSYWFTELSL